MNTNNKVLNHPDKEEIIEWLTNGVTVREVAARLSQRYSKKTKSHLRVSFSTIQTFKKNHLNLDKALMLEIKEARKLNTKIVKHEAEKAAVERTASYQEAIKNLATTEMNTKVEIIKVWTIIENRIEALFDKVSGFDFVDEKAEKLLQGYLSQFMGVIDQHKKYEEGYRETIDINVNISVMNKQVEILQHSIREILQDVDPSLTVTFMGKLNDKMKELSMSGEAGSDKHSAFYNSVLGHDIDGSFS